MGALLAPFGIGAAQEEQSGPAAQVLGKNPNYNSGSDMSDMFRRSFGNGRQGDGMGGLPGMPPGMGGMPGMGGGGMQGGIGNPLAMLMGGGMGGGMQQGGGQQGMQQQYPYGISPPQGMRGGGQQQGGGQQMGGGMGDPLGIMQMLGGL